MVLSNVTNDSYSDYWDRVNQITGGATELLNLCQEFVSKMVELLPVAGAGTWEAVSDDMVIGRYIVPRNTQLSTFVIYKETFFGMRHDEDLLQSADSLKIHKLIALFSLV